MATGINDACHTKAMSTDAHSNVGEYSRIGRKDCMTGICDVCESHGLTAADFRSKVTFDSDSNSEDEADTVVSYFRRKKDGTGFLTKFVLEVAVQDAIEMWQNACVDSLKFL